MFFIFFCFMIEESRSGAEAGSTSVPTAELFPGQTGGKIRPQRKFPPLGKFNFLDGSVANPDPDPYVFGPPGFGSIITRFVTAL
jgi:hypothetical protein